MSLGSLAPGSTTNKTLYLSAVNGTPGPRTIEMTVRAAPKPAANADLSLLPAPTESTCSTNIAVAAPVQARFENQVYGGRRRTAVSITDEWVDASEAILLSTLQASGPWDIEVESICLSADVSRLLLPHSRSLEADSLHLGLRDNARCICLSRIHGEGRCAAATDG